MSKTQTKEKDVGAVEKVIGAGPTAGTALAAAAGGTINFEQDAGAGLEGADKDSFAIPYLVVLQPMSPPVAEGTLEGARPGLFLNSVTQELLSEIDLVPVAFQRRFLRWAPRKLGGGFKGEYSPVDVELRKIEGLVESDDRKLFIGGTDKDVNDSLKDTRIHYVMVVRPDGTFSPAVISMASTQIKRSKRWVARIQGIQERGANGALFNPPSFSHMYHAKSEKETNDQGTWYSWAIDTPVRVNSLELYNACREFHKQIVTGAVVAAPPVEDAAESGGSETF